MPATLWALLFVVVCSVAALVPLTAVRRTRTIAHLETHHEVAGFLIGIVGVVYAVLLAFVVVIVWERYNDASRNLAQEANQIGDLWEMAGGFRSDVRDPARDALVRYARAVVDTEFTSMRAGRPSDQAARAYAQVWQTYRAIEPRGDTEKTIFAESLATVNVLSDARRTRLHDSEDHLPGVLWAALYVGGVITVGFTYVFQLRNYRLQLLMTTGVVAVIALALFVVIALNRPFGVLLPVSADPLVDQIARMRA
jgi:hypothetical protein